ncbi:MAG TPA: hypothetical protein VLS45_10375 [Methylomicrobium sp.]|nr:hypothetical protein [Methylomicrobium sp.]
MFEPLRPGQQKSYEYIGIQVSLFHNPKKKSSALKKSEKYNQPLWNEICFHIIQVSLLHGFLLFPLLCVYLLRMAKGFSFQDDNIDHFGGYCICNRRRRNVRFTFFRTNSKMIMLKKAGVLARAGWKILDDSLKNLL